MRLSKVIIVILLNMLYKKSDFLILHISKRIFEIHWNTFWYAICCRKNQRNYGQIVSWNCFFSTFVHNFNRFSAFFVRKDICLFVYIQSISRTHLPQKHQILYETLLPTKPIYIFKATYYLLFLMTSKHITKSEPCFLNRHTRYQLNVGFLLRQILNGFCDKYLLSRHLSY